MNHQRERAGCAIGGPIHPMFVCEECERSIAHSALRTDVYHDGQRRQCALCDDIFTGPFTGGDVDISRFGGEE